MTQVIDINNIQNKLAKLIAQLKLGEEILIAKKDKPIAKLIGITESKPSVKRKLGQATGSIVVKESFFDSLNQEELDAWENINLVNK